jgi:hypothetical protein
MINSTLALTIISATIADGRSIGNATFGKEESQISFTGSAEYLQDTLTVGAIVIVNGSLRAIKDTTGQTELSINISSAMVVQLPKPIETTVLAPIETPVSAPKKTAAKSTSRKKTPVTV